eukprot:1277268-Pyramimonas_sp.AAC.1
MAPGQPAGDNRNRRGSIDEIHQMSATRVGDSTLPPGTSFDSHAHDEDQQSAAPGTSVRNCSSTVPLHIPDIHMAQQVAVEQ